MKTNWENVNFVEASKYNWHTVAPSITIGSQRREASQPSDTQLILGCLQRIASALEENNKTMKLLNTNIVYLASEPDLDKKLEAEKAKSKKLRAQIKALTNIK